MVPLKIAQARLRLSKKRPYLATALFALTPVPKPGLGTLAVDKWWRLYYDPHTIESWGVEELATVLYHEILHLLRDHPSRLKSFSPRIANIGADLEVNDDLRSEGFTKFPARPLFPGDFGLPEHEVAEFYISELLRRAGLANSSPSQQLGEPSAGMSGEGGGSSEQDNGESGAGSSNTGNTFKSQNTPRQSQSGSQGQSGQHGANNNGQNEKSASSAADVAASHQQSGGRNPASAGWETTPVADSAQSAGRGSEDGQQEGSAGSRSEGSAGGNSSEPSALSQDGSALSTEASSLSQATQSSSRAGSRAGEQGRSADGKAQEMETPMPGRGRCGSAATGQPEWWEEPPNNPDYPAVTDAEAQVLRRAVAQAVIEHAQKNRGDVPAHMQRWAKEILSPKIDWRRELNSLLRRALGAKSGAVDYTYSRPSRRRIPRVVLPSLYQPTPNVAIVVDTSGSMTDSELTQALAEIKGVIRAVGHRAPVTVLAVDAEVHTVKKVFRADEVKLEGGGGTDMRIGIQEALKLRPRPDVIVVITDGETPWPERKPDGVEVVVALTSLGKVPKWAKVVEVKE